MKKLLLLVSLCVAQAAFSQSTKQTPAPAPQNHLPAQPDISRPGKYNVPPSGNPFGAPSAKRHPMPAFQPVQMAEAVRRVYDDNGLPILFSGKTGASQASADADAAAEQAVEYLASLQPPSVKAPMQEFSPREISTDEQGNLHVRLQQVFQGVEVYGGEVLAHTKKGQFEMLNGRYYPTPALTSVEPKLHSADALFRVMQHIGPEKAQDFWMPEPLQIMGYQPYRTQLVVYHKGRKLDSERLAWQVIARPNAMQRWVYFVDAATGEILHHFDHTCAIDGHRVSESCAHNPAPSILNSPFSTLNSPPPPPPVTGSGQDLLNVNRSFGAWEASGTFYLEDASKSMFNAAASQMPGDPVGAIVTLDAKNTSPATSSFTYDLVKSASSTFSNKAAVSAHWNSIRSYDYFQSTFNRKSIDGVGGNILALINVADEDGSSMENAFWNGEAIWYGNGGSSFKPLARGLDVAGHEMTHGVVEKTANLEYQDESGALNESFADVFGVMIDRDDWKIGEDVMQPGASNSGALRDLQDPNNAAPKNSSFWQPKHMNEKYTGTGDNGGVHINSGIPNHAFYLFANNAAVGKDKAEQVYYKALRDYLVKSSQFVDCRIAVIQAAKDLYGTAISDIAANAFAAVGIGSSQPSGNYQGQLAVNPGKDYLYVVSNDYQNLDLALGNGSVLGTIYNQGLRSRPSVRDNGTEAVFVNEQGQIILVTLEFFPNGDIQPTVDVLENQPIWHNTAISKDGRFVAFTTEERDNLIYIYDFAAQKEAVFELYNPTFTQGQITDDVQYSDVLEFDYSGENLMYDAYNELPNGQAFGYWDIGFLQFWEGGQFADPQEVFISKLFSGIPDNTSIGNPAFAKNSPYIIAFDFIDETSATTRNDIYSANVETGDYDIVVSNNGSLGWPNFTRTDNAIVYERASSASTANLRLQGLAPSKIAPQGSSTALVNNRRWGVWFANGNRSLQVSGIEELSTPAFNLSLSPNPTGDWTRLSLTSPESESARLSVTNLLGEVLQSRSVELSAGDNAFDLELGGLPVGMYVVHLHTSRAQGAIVVVKR
jgi:bacillolysin